MNQRSTPNRSVSVNEADQAEPSDSDLVQVNYRIPKAYANALAHAKSVTGRTRTKIFTMLVDIGIKRIISGENTEKTAVAKLALTIKKS